MMGVWRKNDAAASGDAGAGRRVGKTNGGESWNGPNEKVDDNELGNAFRWSGRALGRASGVVTGSLKET